MGGREMAGRIEEVRDVEWYWIDLVENGHEQPFARSPGGKGASIDRFALPWGPRIGEIQVSAKRSIETPRLTHG